MSTKSNPPGGGPPSAPPGNPPVKLRQNLLENNPVFDRIREDLAGNDIVLYMKGSAGFPQCGYSAAVALVLKNLGVAFRDIDVLSDAALRQGVKDFANWPTIPQLYIKGEFIGGCDIVRDMYAAGELQDLLRQKKLMADE